MHSHGKMMVADVNENCDGMRARRKRGNNGKTISLTRIAAITISRPQCLPSHTF